MADLRIRLLGVPQIEVEGAGFAVDTRKAVALLAYLAVTRQPQGRDTLAALLWPDYDGDSARSSLRRTLSALRKALGDRWLSPGRDSISLDATGAWLDVSAFREGIEAPHAHGHAPEQTCDACAEALEKAVALYRDDFMAGFNLRDSPEYEDWQSYQAQELRRRLDLALERLVALLSARGELEGAIGHARRRLALDALNEAAHVALIELYALAGDRTAALRQYRECVRVLEEELGVPPLPETTRLYESIFAGEVAPRPTAVANVSPITSQGVELRSGPSAWPLVGRAPELSTLQQAYESASSNGRLVVVEGEAGIGKTRLVAELIGRVQAGGASVLSAQCYEGESVLAFGPVAALLRAALALPGASERLSGVSRYELAEASRILPELAHGGSEEVRPALDSPAAQERFLGGVASVLAVAVSGDESGVLLVEDVHWADEATLDLLTYLARRAEGRRLLLVLTWRTEEVPARHRLRRLLAERDRAGAATHVQLQRLDVGPVRELVASALPGFDASAGLAARLYEETEGLPLFLTQYLAAVEVSSGQVEDALPVPGGIRDLLLTRLAQAGPAEQQVLGAAAVIGRSFDFDVLHTASGRSEEEAIAALESLEALGFIRSLDAVGAEDGGPAYDFSHDKMRELVYEQTSLARRRLLHRRVAEAYSRAPAARQSQVASRVAHHYRLAGQEQDASAYFYLAAQRSRSLGANVEALSHLQAALDAGHADTSLIHEEMGDVLTLTGAYGAAQSSYQTAAALAVEARLPAIEHKIGALYLRLGSWALAEQHLRASLEEAGGDAASRVLADLALALHRQARYEEARTLIDDAAARAGATHDDLALAQAHNIAGVMANFREDHDDALEHLRRSLAIAERLDDPGARIASLNNLALVMRSKDELGPAQDLTSAAIELCVRQGDRHREAALRNNLADLLRAAGRDDEAMVCLKDAVAIFAEIGADMGSLEPEVWKLIDW